MNIVRVRHHRSSKAFSVNAGALSVVIHVVALFGLSVFLGDRGSPQVRRVVTLEVLPPTEVVASLPEPLEVVDEITEAAERLPEDPLEEPETVTQEFPPEPPEPDPEFAPLPFDDPQGVRVRVAPFTTLPEEPLEPEPVAVVSPDEAEETSAPDTPDASAASSAHDPGPTRGPIFVHGREPEYPALSRRLGEEGTVLCRLFIGDDGRVMRVELVRSSGYPRLDEAAIEALRGWRFLSALEQGLSVPAEFTHTVRFRIE